MQPVAGRGAAWCWGRSIGMTKLVGGLVNTGLRVMEQGRRRQGALTSSQRWIGGKRVGGVVQRYNQAVNVDKGREKRQQ